MENSIKKFSSYKLVLGAIEGIVGLVTVILAIVKLCSKEGDPTAALRIVLGISLLVIGTCLLVYSLLNKENRISSELFIGAGSIGIGSFLFTKPAEGTLDVIVCFIVPILVACFGGALAIKAIINLVNKKATTPNAILLVISICAVVLGIIFAVFADSWASKVCWLLVGLTLFSLGVYNVIFWAKTIKKIK